LRRPGSFVRQLSEEFFLRGDLDQYEACRCLRPLPKKGITGDGGALGVLRH
jgi:hypothetical protein